MKYRLYNVNNSKKSDVKGYWLNKGKLYRDNIFIKGYNNKKLLHRDINGLFDNGEKAVMYTYKNRGYIQDKTGYVKILRHKRSYKRLRLLSQDVKALVKQYGGATIYKRLSGYNIEVYHNMKGIK